MRSTVSVIIQKFNRISCRQLFAYGQSSKADEMEDTIMIKRIGMLTSGGDCQALNATMRGVVKGLSNSVDELEVYGFDDGYKD